MTNREVGAWELLSFQHFPEAGEAFGPLGSTPFGRLLYTADGFVSISMSTGNRPHFKEPSPWNGTDLEKVQAFSTFVSYSGRYVRDADKVVHIVEMSLFPNMTGVRLERFISFEPNGDLVLTSPRFVGPGGAMETSKAVWRKLASQSGTVRPV